MSASVRFVAAQKDVDRSCADLGGCYRPRQITLPEITIILQMIRKPNPIFLYSFKIKLNILLKQAKTCLPRSMLSFRLHLPVSRQTLEIKGCLVWEIFFTTSYTTKLLLKFVFGVIPCFSESSKNNADKSERRFGVILTPFSSSKWLLIKTINGPKVFLADDYHIWNMQSHAKRFARIESDWTFREGDSSLISNISCPKQSNLLLHFLRTENCLSRSFGTVERLSL